MAQHGPPASQRGGAGATNTIEGREARGTVATPPRDGGGDGGGADLAVGFWERVGELCEVTAAQPQGVLMTAGVPRLRRLRQLLAGF